jgi:2-methylcitrate dehydratase PrpD
MQQPEMQALLKYHSSTGKSSVLGTGKRAGCLDAALLNGTAGTWLELNEGNLIAKGHPGIQVLPAALALAQESGASGEALLMAIALGYEVSSRDQPRGADEDLGASARHLGHARRRRSPAGRLKGFDESRMLELINVATTMGMATSRQTLLDGATVRNIFTGHSGYMGLTAARLVECGFTGEKDSPGVHLRQGARRRLRSGEGDREPRPRMDPRAGLFQASTHRGDMSTRRSTRWRTCSRAAASSISRASSASR